MPPLTIPPHLAPTCLGADFFVEEGTEILTKKITVHRYACVKPFAILLALQESMIIILIHIEKLCICLTFLRLFDHRIRRQRGV